MSWRDKIAAVLAGKVGGPTPTGIHVYHSSPHDFDRFDLSKIGTGEGAQVYGHGIYAAENPAVSGQGGQYWNQFSSRFKGPESLATTYLSGQGFEREPAIARLRKSIAEHQAEVDAGAFHYPMSDTKWKPMTDDEKIGHALNLEKSKNALALLESGAPIGPRTYEVNFRAKPEELLDWDKTLAQQPAGPAAWNVAKKWLFGSPEKMTGEEAYRGIAAIEDKARASNVFRDEAGIPGIRYLDEGSRQPAQLKTRLDTLRTDLANAEMKGVGQPDVMRRQIESLQNQLSSVPPLTHNYVAFDPSKLDIMAKYGVVGGVPLGAATMGATIDQSTYGERQ